MSDLLTISAHEIIFLVACALALLAFFANVVRCDESLKLARSNAPSNDDTE